MNDDWDPQDEHPGWLWLLAVLLVAAYVTPWVLWLLARHNGGH